MGIAAPSLHSKDTRTIVVDLYRAGGPSTVPVESIKTLQTSDRISTFGHRRSHVTTFEAGKEGVITDQIELECGHFDSAVRERRASSKITDQNMAGESVFFDNNAERGGRHLEQRPPFGH